MGRKDFERLPQQERQFLALCLASVVLCGVLAVFLPCQRRNLRSLGL